MYCSRRRWLTTVAGAGAAAFTKPLWSATGQAPGSRVAVARCHSYDAELMPALERMFDQLGGLGSLVKGKTVAIKVNLTGPAFQRLGYAPAELSHFTHPNVIGAAVHLIGKAGAQRIRVLEGCYNSADPLEQYMYEAGWDPAHILNAASKVDMENTNWLSKSKRYVRFDVPHGGHVYPGFDLSEAYHNCDVFVSIAKMKEHATAGVTLTMKNLFGVAPITIYGGGAGRDEPSDVPRGGRDMFHYGYREPSKSAPGENAGIPKKDDGLRVPRIVADLVAARPIHLGIIDGIVSMNHGEGPWIRGGKIVKPGLLVAGLNPVCTDAVGTALMGFDPMAERGTPPFEHRDSTLQYAEMHGVGTRDLRKIEVVGAPIEGNVFKYRNA